LNENILYLLSVLESIEKIKIYTRDFSDADEFFEANYQKDFNATLNVLIAIGEDVKNLDESLKKKIPSIDWQSIVDMRNILSHNYRGVDRDIVWDIVVDYIEPLKTKCIELLKGLKPNKKKLKSILNTSYYREIKYLEDLIYKSESDPGN
jgi:uncharacterized protein with HEPN domain